MLEQGRIFKKKKNFSKTDETTFRLLCQSFQRRNCFHSLFELSTLISRVSFTSGFSGCTNLIDTSALTSLQTRFEQQRVLVCSLEAAADLAQLRVKHGYLRVIIAYSRRVFVLIGIERVNRDPPGTAGTPPVTLVKIHRNPFPSFRFVSVCQLIFTKLTCKYNVQCWYYGRRLLV